MKSILITGASGFIGQFLTSHFLKKDYNVIGIDIKEDKFKCNGYTHLTYDLSDNNNTGTIISILKDKNIDTVFHLAAKIKVDKSMTNPHKYYKNNIVGLINLLDILKSINVYNIIFASTAAVYNIDNITDKSGIFSEEYTNGFNGLSVYGETKLYAEKILQEYSIYGFKGYIFRFFNVGGKYPDKNVCHLIDILINNINQGFTLKVFGNNYDTKDGTCIRDYIHVKDIINAFDMCNQSGYNHTSFKIYNLGSQKGYTVSEIINEVIKNYEELNGMKVKSNIEICNRRDGDMSITVANSNKIENDIGWKCIYTLKDIVIDTIKTYGEIEKQK
jgi:UDP-glucose 4-epimerase